MNEVLAATLGGLIALVFWGVSDWLASRNSKSLSGIEVNLAIHLTSGAVLLVIYLLSGQGLPTLSQFLIIMLSSLFFTIGYIIFIKALSTGHAGVIVPLSSTYPLFALLITYMFFTTTFSGLNLAAMLIIVAGAILVGTEKMNWRKLHKTLSREVFLALIVALLLGVEIVFLNLVVDELPWETLAAFAGICASLIILTLSFIRNWRLTASSLLSLHKNKVGIAAGITIALGSIGFFLGAEISGNLIIPSVISAASILVTSLLAAVYDHEKLIISKRIGAVFVVIGVVLLNFQ